MARYVTSTAADGVFLISEGNDRRLIATVKAPREVAEQMAAAPELVEALTGLTTLLEGIREDSVSTHFRFGNTEAERKNRIQQLLGFIEANAERVDDALEAAGAALAKARGA